MTLPIEEITLHAGKGRCQVRFSYGSQDTFHFTLVRIRSGSITGFGEGLGEGIDQIEANVRELPGRDALALDSLLADAPERGNTFTEAVSLALYDLVAKAAGVPLAALLGGPARRRVPLMPAIFPTTAADAAAKARRFHEEGFRALKFKMMGDLDEDLANLEAIRGEVDPETMIQGDANCGYKDRDALIKALPLLEAKGLDIFEDPLEGSLADYAGLPGKSTVKIMIDAGARSEVAIRDILQARCCDIINQHPCQQGGLGRALRQSHAAELMGIPTMVGGTGFFGVGTAAYHHLASVIGLSMPCGELGGFCDHGFQSQLVKTPLPISAGSVEIPDTPGIGVEIDEKSLERLSSEQRHVG